MILHPSPVRNPLNQPGYEFEPLITYCPEAASNSKAGRWHLAEQFNSIQLAFIFVQKDIVQNK